MPYFFFGVVIYFVFIHDWSGQKAAQRRAEKEFRQALINDALREAVFGPFSRARRAKRKGRKEFMKQKVSSVVSDSPKVYSDTAYFS